MNSAQLHAVEYMRSFVGGPDRSPAAARRLEDALRLAFPEDDHADDLVVALASYRPEGGPHLYDEPQMVMLLAQALPVFVRMASDGEAR